MELLEELPRPPRGEACGILLGTPSRGRPRVVRFLPARNVSQDPLGFLIDPLDVVRAREEAESSGLEILGIYHSHPSGRPEPSPRDVEAMVLWPLVWVIGSPHGVEAWRACSGSLKRLRILWASRPSSLPGPA